MLQRNLLFSSCLIGSGLMLCGWAHAADDAAAICNAAVSAYAAAAASGDPVKMAAIFAPDGELVSPSDSSSDTTRCSSSTRLS